MGTPRYPSLYQVNTRVRLSEIERELGRPATLDDIPDAELDRLAAAGFDWIWFLGVWQTGPAGRRVSLSDSELRREYQQTLPDFDESDVTGSCFSVQAYRVHADFGGDAALARLRKRINRRGLRLMLDFIVNHTAPDHPWVEEHPDYYVHGTESQLAAEPENYARILTSRGPMVIAYGRDPCFPGWSDTMQLNYGNPMLQEAMIGELARIAEMCDGVRCDMAMLVLPDVFEETWNIMPEPFWPRAIEHVRQEHPGFVFLAEVYWDLEWTMQQQGFDYAYDKRLYDRLRDRHPHSVRDHLRAAISFQDKLARFLENHDEARAASVFPRPVHWGAALASFLAPGLRIFHQGQLEGRKVRIPMQLRRGPTEPDDPDVQSFYNRLLGCLREPIFRKGDWQLLECEQAWDGNWTWDCFIAFAWQDHAGQQMLAAVNYADHRSQCFVALPFEGLGGSSWILRDLMSEAVYERDGDSLASDGLYLDLPAWGHHVFRMTKSE